MTADTAAVASAPSPAASGGAGGPAEAPPGCAAGTAGVAGAKTATAGTPATGGAKEENLPRAASADGSSAAGHDLRAAAPGHRDAGHIVSQKAAGNPHEGQPWVTETPFQRQERIKHLFREFDRKGHGVLVPETLHRVPEHGEEVVSLSMWRRWRRSRLDDWCLESFCHCLESSSYSCPRLFSNANQQNPSYASELVELRNDSRARRVDFPEFERYIHAKEKKLWKVFTDIDESGDGRIQPDELMKSLQKAGITLSNEELHHFLGDVDSKKDGAIDYAEWRDSLLLLPTGDTDLHHIYHFFRKKVSHVDLEGNVFIPRQKGESPMRNVGYFLAGGLAGAVSRTCTAPLDRLKVYLITHANGGGGNNAVAAATWGGRRVIGGRVIEAVRNLYATGGIATFFRGNGINVIKIAPESALKFWCYETGKSFLASFARPAVCSTKDKPVSQRQDDSSAVGMSGRFVAGGFAGIASQSFIYPLETVKTRVMAETQEAAVARFESTAPVVGAGSPATSAVMPRPMSQVSGPPTAAAASAGGQPIPTAVVVSSSRNMSTLASKASWSDAAMRRLSILPLSAWSRRWPFGLFSPAVVSARTSAVLAEKPTPPARPPQLSACGRGGLMQSSLVMRTVRQLYLEGGIKAFYRGLTPAMLGVFPYAAIDMSIFESLKLAYMTYRDSKLPNPPTEPVDPAAIVLLGCGTISGTIGATTVYPLAFIRTRLQAQGTPSHPTRYAGSMDLIRATYTREGFSGFYKGLAPTLLKVVPAVSIGYVIYEKSLAQFGLK